MAGKAAIRIGGTTPLATTITGLTGTAMSSQGMTVRKGEPRPGFGDNPRSGTERDDGRLQRTGTLNSKYEHRN
jgi:hypothetical protein